ncbi:hypothetical protein WMY93_027838 [Mugilogobius chulae]|uniref:Uncharacterized protein n=1 Tax=Mugilogobius chulae TaxID=88201 RepID=A0AAW0MYE6_9GOBI
MPAFACCSIVCCPLRSGLCARQVEHRSQEPGDLFRRRTLVSLRVRVNESPKSHIGVFKEPHVALEPQVADPWSRPNLSVTHEFSSGTVGRTARLGAPEQVNAFLSFVVPMVAISALNGVIANQLLRMFKEAEQENRMCIIGGNPTMLSVSVEPNRAQSLRHGVVVLNPAQMEYTLSMVCYSDESLLCDSSDTMKEALKKFVEGRYALVQVDHMTVERFRSTPSCPSWFPWSPSRPERVKANQLLARMFRRRMQENRGCAIIGRKDTSMPQVVAAMSSPNRVATSRV